MNKLAIFVEGQTEQIFAEQLIRYLGREKNVGIQVQRLSGGRKGSARTVTEMTGTSNITHQDYFILIVDCGHDSRVKSDINDRYDGLMRENYQAIIGIRDVYPTLREDIQKLREGFAWRLRIHPIEPLLVLEIMEIEAWFLAEHAHFLQIHPSLTIDRIQQNFGFDPSQEDMQLRDHPSQDLENIYFLENIAYHKTRDHIERTVRLLDFDVITQKLTVEMRDLENLVHTIQRFFHVA